MWECGENDANTPLEGAPNVPWASQVVLVIKNSADNVGDKEMRAPSLGWGDPLENSGNDNPLQYSCLENPMDRGAWRAAFHGVAKNKT